MPNKRITTAMAYNEALSRRHLTAEARVPFRYCKCRTYGEHCALEKFSNKHVLFLWKLYMLSHLPFSLICCQWVVKQGNY